MLLFATLAIKPNEYNPRESSEKMSDLPLINFAIPLEPVTITTTTAENWLQI